MAPDVASALAQLSRREDASSLSRSTTGFVGFWLRRATVATSMSTE
jgi:hypothetical protein